MALIMNLSPTPEPTINEIEQAVQRGLEELRGAPLNDKITGALKFLTPSGYRPIVQFEEDGRKKRSTAAASNWNPETGEIVIFFEPLQPSRQESVAPTPIDPAGGTVPTSGVTAAVWGTQVQVERIAISDAKVTDLQEITPLQIQQCCEALAEAEKAGKSFIALKWFRDNDLMASGHAWAASLAARQAVLTKAIDLGAILTSQIPNPKAPQHPTTTLKLNRTSEFARSIPPRFQPIQLRGNGPTASEIVIRDRGRF